ncbi:MAG: alkaline phosphatase family protein [Promethearchaeota archaeon]
MGLDRLHHGFWKFYDENHNKYKSGNIFESAIKNYYKKIDKEIGEILNLLDNNTMVFVVSDHGAKAMKGCICINMALEKLGLLKFKKNHKPGTKLQDAEVDWKKTYAWGWGGYYGRIFLNMKGREEYGIIDPEDYENWRDNIIKLLKSVPDNHGNPMNTIILKPEKIFSIINGDCPDLMVYFDDLNWRSAGTIGYETMYLDENDTGPDDAVHDYYGIFIIFDPKKKIGKNIGPKTILDIMPTILDIFGIEIPKDIEGKIIRIK